jgi:hypothetical protein
MPSDFKFPVELQPITTEPGGLFVPNRLAVVRTDTMKPIGVVSKKYTLLPHADVVDALRETLKGQETQEKIGLTHNGARMHLEITLPNITLRNGGTPPVHLGLLMAQGTCPDRSRSLRRFSESGAKRGVIGNVRRQYDAVWRALDCTDGIAELDAVVVIDRRLRFATDDAQDGASLISSRALPRTLRKPARVCAWLRD